MIGFNDMKFESWHCRWWILGISQDPGCWDPGPFGPGICMAGPVMVNHPEKVEEKSLLKCQVGELTRPYMTIFTYIYHHQRGLLKQPPPGKIIWWEHH